MEDYKKLINDYRADNADFIPKARKRLFSGYQNQLMDLFVQGYTFFGYDVFEALVDKFMLFIKDDNDSYQVPKI